MAALVPTLPKSLLSEGYSTCSTFCSLHFFFFRAPGFYNMYLGAAHDGSRLNKLYKASVNEQQIIAELDPIIRRLLVAADFSWLIFLFLRYAKERQPNEYFGDFVIRVGIIKASENGALFHQYTDVADLAN